MDTHGVLVEERRGQLLARLESDGRLVASAEAHRFEVSEDTIKRDLRHLASLGRLTRVRGGALPAAPASEPYPQRRADPATAPLIEAVARRLVESRGVIVLDAGTTNLEVARALPDDAAITIVTSAPAIADAASTKGISVLMLGGLVEPDVGAAVDATAVAALRSIRADIAVLGLCAIHPADGITAIRPDEVEFKRAVIEAGAEALAIAPGSKLGAEAPFMVAGIRSLDVIVTGVELAEDRISAFIDAGVEVIRA